MTYQHEIREKKVRYRGPRPSIPRHNIRLDKMFDKYLGNRHLDPRLARANGWFPAVYKDAPRVIIPCTNSEGVSYFQGRDMTDTHPLRYASPASSRDDSIVLVWPDEDNERKGLVICEGPTDALAAAGVGFVGIGLMGNQPTPEILDHVVIYARAIKPIIIVPDIDALEFGSTILNHLAQVALVARIYMPESKDLASMTVRQRETFFGSF